MLQGLDSASVRACVVSAVVGGGAFGQPGVVETGGAVVAAEPPADIGLGSWESSSEIRLWFERESVFDECGTIGHVGSGFVSRLSERTPGFTAGRTQYRSYMVRVDPVATGTVELGGYVVFDEPIHGVYFGNQLTSLDEVAGRPGVTYNENSDRGLELDGNSDSFMVSEDRMRLDVFFRASTRTDDLRVLVGESPMPPELFVNLVRNGGVECFVEMEGGATLVGNERSDLFAWSVARTPENGDVGVFLNNYAGPFAPLNGRPEGGGDYFALGARAERTIFSQEVDIASVGGIEAGAVAFRAGALLGSYFDLDRGDRQDDRTTLRVTTVGGAGETTSYEVTGPNNPEDVGLSFDERKGSFLAEYELVGVVPAGTERLLVEVVSDRDDLAAENDVNHGLFDRVRVELEPRCPADVNLDAMLNGADFNAWLTAFGNGDAIADQNRDGVLNGADFNAWLTNFGLGCG